MDCMQSPKAGYQLSLAGFNTASGMDCMQSIRTITISQEKLFQYRKRYGLHAIYERLPKKVHWRVSIPQAVWIACNKEGVLKMKKIINSFNTASGMDCMQYTERKSVWFSYSFQYRKRYGLHAISHGGVSYLRRASFQYRKRYGLHAIRPPRAAGVLPAPVSIPQAVWIACNSCSSPWASRARKVSIPQAVWIACNGQGNSLCQHDFSRFNTASGMDCMQY